MKIVEVKAGRPYQVRIGSGLLEHSGAYAAEVHPPCAAALVMDKTVAALYGERVRASFEGAGFRVEPYVFSPGESAKNLEELSLLLEFMAGKALGRNDLLVALGGGVAGDLGGFAASVYQRGIPYIQLPTTLLAAVDSSVGGKTAVNLRAGKNLAGTFWQPELVICDCDTFSTLPPQELSAGAAECVKYAMLDDASLLETLTENGQSVPWEEIVESCVLQKARYVEKDERENDLRQFLNFGHTIGHAAERLSGYTIRHGDGVAMGMMVITRAAERMGLCETGVSEKLKAALEALELPTNCPYPAQELADAALSDKKRRGDTITLVLPHAAGRCELHRVQTADLPDIARLGLET
ncbi:MAG: 3-dehydroquinate synthase [Christensenellales bacterium]|jgi:3-dehydroquinate synthase